jgi:hypothetical protein
MISERWQHAGEDFEPQVLLIAQPVGTTLDDADFVIQAFDEAERDFVLRFAVGAAMPSQCRSIMSAKCS